MEKSHIKFILIIFEKPLITITCETQELNQMKFIMSDTTLGENESATGKRK